MHAPGCKVQFLDIPSMSSINAGSQVCWILLLKTLAYSTKTRPGQHGRFQKKSWYILLSAGSCLHSATQSRSKMHAGLVAQVILLKNKTNKENGGNCREPFLLLGRVPFPGLASAMGCLKPLTSWKQGAPSVSIGRQLNRWNRLQILLKLTDLVCPYFARFNPTKKRNLQKVAGSRAICCHKDEASKSNSWTVMKNLYLTKPEPYSMTCIQNIACIYHIYNGIMVRPTPPFWTYYDYQHYHYHPLPVCGTGTGTGENHLKSYIFIYKLLHSWFIVDSYTWPNETLGKYIK